MFSIIHTSAQALSTDNLSIVEALSLYSGEESLPSFSLAKELTNSWWTRRRSFRSRATPLPIQQLHTWQYGSTYYVWLDLIIVCLKGNLLTVQINQQY